MEDLSSPTREIIVPVPEVERRKKDIDKVPSDHSLLPIARHCLKDRDKERPTAAQLCQSLEQLKTAPSCDKSMTECQASPDRQATEIVRLQEQVKEREMPELECRLQSAQITPAQPQRSTAAVRRVSKPEACL